MCVFALHILCEKNNYISFSALGAHIHAYIHKSMINDAHMACSCVCTYIYFTVFKVRMCVCVCNVMYISPQLSMELFKHHIKKICVYTRADSGEPTSNHRWTNIHTGEKVIHTLA